MGPRQASSRRVILPDVERTVRVPGAVLTLGLALLAWPEAARADELRPTFRVFEKGEDVEETYALNTFGIVHEEMFSPSPFTIVFGGVWWRPVRGKYRQALAYRDFYEALGRPDLADAQAHQHLVSSLLVWGGLAMEVGGAVLFFTGLSSHGLSTPGKIGIGVFAGGLVASAVGASTDKPAVSEEEALALAAQYDAALREHFGLGAAFRAPGSPRFALSPIFGHRTEGLSIRVAF